MFKKSHLLLPLTLILALLAGCATLDEKQRFWIFQPSDRTWAGGLSAAEGMEDVWIDFASPKTGKPVVDIILDRAGQIGRSGAVQDGHSHCCGPL